MNSTGDNNDLIKIVANSFLEVSVKISEQLVENVRFRGLFQKLRKPFRGLFQKSKKPLDKIPAVS